MADDKKAKELTPIDKIQRELEESKNNVALLNKDLQEAKKSIEELKKESETIEERFAIQIVAANFGKASIKDMIAFSNEAAAEYKKNKNK